MKEQILELFNDNSDSLKFKTDGIESTITFIGSMNYSDIADKIIELIKKDMILKSK